MKLTVTKGSEWELRDAQNRLVVRVYDVYSKTVRNPSNDSFFAIETRAEDLAHEMADLCAGETAEVDVNTDEESEDFDVMLLGPELAAILADVRAEEYEPSPYDGTYSEA